MRHLTNQQKAFISAYIRTGKAELAAREAGYSATDARSRASKLLKQKEIQAEIERQLKVANSDQHLALDQKYEDPLAFLAALMGDPNADPRLRTEAAKALLPYVHPKIAPRGKKEEQQEAAKLATQGRYRPSRPPILKSVK
ncbi:terminase small subunit [Pseudomonas luteola]|uniref:terminase small subunit n=1 Tax=Pseudomonas luteola TaxID=47886 RepID=UPI0028A2725A|nr:terminase small subunit [Pseudomonas luteola]